MVGPDTCRDDLGLRVLEVLGLGTTAMPRAERLTSGNQSPYIHGCARFARFPSARTTGS